MRSCLLILLLLPFAGQAVLAGAIGDDFLREQAARLDPLFESLDKDHPQMRIIRHEWAVGNKAAAAEALVAWFEDKLFPVEILEPLDFPDDLEMHARAALGESFYLLSEWETVPSRSDGGIDWLDRGERGDKERAWMLNRHGFLPDLAEVYERTGDRRYSDQLNALWQDWILSNPYPDRLTFSPPWRALEVARRILNAWVHVFYGYDVLTAETRLLVLASLLDHGDALREHASFWGGNHLISEKLALLTLAAAWPELEPAGEWQAHAIDAVTTELMQQTYPDGSYRELSNHYQRVVLVNAQYFLSLLSLLDPDYRDRPIVGFVERMWDFFARVMRPDGTGPLSNASDLEHNAAFVGRVWEFFERGDWRYLSTGGSEGTRPAADPSHVFPWAGQAILRSSWESDAHWAYFDAGPYGSGHQHVDRLHVSASIAGRALLVDSGRYTYQPGPWRDYFKGPLGHNTLMLDGKAAEQGPRIVDQPMPVAFVSGDGFAFAAATSRFAPEAGPFGLPALRASVPWTRAVILDKRGLLLVVDHLVPFRDHDLEARWHFHPDVSDEAAMGSLRLLLPAEGFRKTVRRGSGPPAIGGFFSRDYNLRQPACELLFSGRVSRPVTLLWGLQAPDSPPLEAERLSDPGEPVLELRLHRDGVPFAEARLRLYPEPELLDYKPL